MARTLGVVVPAYRPDVDGLATLVSDIRERLEPDTLRIELDAPSPGTARAIDRLDATVSTVDDRRGKGAAITHGFEALSTDVFAFLDADGSVPAGSFADVVTPVVSGDADLATGSRRHPDANVRIHQTLLRRRLGDGFATLARLALEVDLYDYQCGAKAIDRETWEAVRSHLYEPGFAWDVELIAIAGAVGARIVEVPVTWIDHPDSTVDTLETGLSLARALVAARHRAALLQDNPVAVGIDSYRTGTPPLVERTRAEND